MNERERFDLCQRFLAAFWDSLDGNSSVREYDTIRSLRGQVNESIRDAWEVAFPIESRCP